MAKKEYILIDSNIVIGLLRGNNEVKQVVETFGEKNLCISEINVTEVLIG